MRAERLNWHRLRDGLVSRRVSMRSSLFDDVEKMGRDQYRCQGFSHGIFERFHLGTHRLEQFQGWLEFLFVQWSAKSERHETRQDFGCLLRFGFGFAGDPHYPLMTWWRPSGIERRLQFDRMDGDVVTRPRSRHFAAQASLKLWIRFLVPLRLLRWIGISAVGITKLLTFGVDEIDQTDHAIEVDVGTKWTLPGLWVVFHPTLEFEGLRLMGWRGDFGRADLFAWHMDNARHIPKRDLQLRKAFAFGNHRTGANQYSKGAGAGKLGNVQQKLRIHRDVSPFGATWQFADGSLRGVIAIDRRPITADDRDLQSPPCRREIGFDLCGGHLQRRPVIQKAIGGCWFGWQVRG